MTKDELLTQLRLLEQSGDPEAAHCTADNLLLEYLADDEIKVAFENVPKWYS